MEFTYKGLQARYNRHTVTGEEVDRQLQRLLQQNPRITPVTDRPTRSGDEVVLDYAGFCDGEQFAGGTAEMQTLVLGSGMFIPGFEEQLINKMPGEEVVVKVTFPTPYHSEALAGKEAEFRCKLHEIRVKTAYELDDTFAQEVGGCYTLEEMREKMQEEMQAYADKRGEMDLQERLLQQAADTLDFTPTAEALEAAVEEQMQELQGQLAQQGLNLDMYCSFLKTTPEALREDARPAAEAALRKDAAVKKIIELEKLEVEDKEIQDALSIICSHNGLGMEQLQQYCTPEFEEAVCHSILTGKVMGLIRENATVTVV
jgi:trigger factor